MNNIFSSFFVNSFTFFDDLQNMEGAESNTEICEIIKTGKNLKKRKDNKSCSTWDGKLFSDEGLKKKDPISDYISGLSLILSLSTINYSWWP